MNRTIYIINFMAAVLMAGFACACSESSEPEPPTPAPPQTDSRTVLVYMAADNNLGSNDFDAVDIAEMKVGVKDIDANARWLVYHSGYKKEPVLIEITRAGVDTLARFGSGTPATSAARMADVIATSRELAPANGYGLVVWGHGTGWIQDGIADDRLTYSLGPDGGKKMNISTLADVIEDCGGFDYIYFDCCYMASVETVYELRHCARYIVGSATELPANGMDYSVNVPYLADGSEEALIRSARNTYEHYDALSGDSRTCTISVIKTAGLDELAEKTASMYMASGTAFGGYTPQRFTDLRTTCYYYDFKDFVRALPVDCYPEFVELFNKVVIYSANTPYLWASVDLSRHNGLSTYIPTQGFNLEHRNYNTLEWYADVARYVPMLIQ